MNAFLSIVVVLYAASNRERVPRSTRDGARFPHTKPIPLEKPKDAREQMRPLGIFYFD